MSGLLNISRKYHKDLTGRVTVEMQGQTIRNDGNTPKVIKRYQNRKLYDTQQSCYVTLDDIAKMIRTNENVTVVDNKTKRDITASTLSQIIFEAEKKAANYAPLNVLREIIQNNNGSMSSFLAKLGVFNPEAKKEEESIEMRETLQPPSYDDLKSNLDQRVNNASKSSSYTNNPSSSVRFDSEPATPKLPGANRTLGNSQ